MTRSGESDGALLLSLLLVLFIGLKLGGVIAWPWCLVLAPLWAPFALVALLVVIAAAVMLIGCLSAGLITLLAKWFPPSRTTTP